MFTFEIENCSAFGEGISIKVDGEEVGFWCFTDPIEAFAYVIRKYTK